MSKLALIDPDGRVVQIEPEDNEFEVAPPFQWVSCLKNTSIGMLFQDGVFFDQPTDQG